MNRATGERDRLLTDEVLASGRDAGLAAVGVAAAEPFSGTLHDLESRKAAGLHAGMQFTYRNPARSSDPTRSLPDAASLVVGAWAYRRSGPDSDGRPSGRVASYVWEDHYARLRDALSQVADLLVSRGYRARLLVDDNALVDREAAYRAGIGWYGKNANLLLPGQGSWFVLGSVVTDAPLTANTPVVEDCGTCTRCIEGCPTGAIIAPGVVDARRCLAWLVQADGDFPEEYRGALGDRIYGCDDCQEVCPPNRRASRQPAAAVASGSRWVSLIDLLSQDDETLMARHGVWYVPRRDPDYLRRNALVALGNVGRADDPAVATTLRTYLAHESPMLRRHAVWAAERIGCKDLGSDATPSRHQ